jgi:uncharacterized protein (DUF2147 family)
MLKLAEGLTIREVALMMLRKLCWIAAIIFSTASYSQSTLADPRGLWLAQDGAQVRVTPCGGYLCATLVKTKSPVDPETGQPWTDKHSHDPAQRSRPLIGTAVLYSLVPDGLGKWSGRLYNVDSGESYEGHLLELNARTVRVEGCAIGICGGQNMTRIQ